METYDSRAAFQNPLLPDAISRSGVDMSSMRIDYLVDVAREDH
jgi:hypothetical protein